MANSVDPDETARDEPSHQDLNCLQRNLYWSVGIKVLSLSSSGWKSSDFWKKSLKLPLH